MLGLELSASLLAAGAIGIVIAVLIWKQKLQKRSVQLSLPVPPPPLTEPSTEPDSDIDRSEKDIQRIESLVAWFDLKV